MTKVFTTLKDALRGSHWAITGHLISSPTVKVECVTAPRFEVVPAGHFKTVGEDNVFPIPSPGSQWEESAPRAHLRFINQQNGRLGKKVEPLVRLTSMP